jgi:hypothetical protein
MSKGTLHCPYWNELAFNWPNFVFEKKNCLNVFNQIETPALVTLQKQARNKPANKKRTTTKRDHLNSFSRNLHALHRLLQPTNDSMRT